MGAVRPRLMALGFNIEGTGLTRVMRSVLSELAGRYEIDFLGIGDTKPTREIDGVRMHPTNTAGGGDAFGALQALDMAERDPPDILFILHDFWMFDYYTKIFKALRPRTKLVGYVPLDGDIPDPGLVRSLASLDLVLVYTEWAEAEVRNAFSELQSQGVITDAPPVGVIPHGVDAGTFAPDSALTRNEFTDHGRIAAKRDVFGDVPWLEESFVVLNAARPAVRKRVDLTIEGFAQFVRNKPTSVKLCLHHAITEPETADLRSLVERLGIGDHVITNPLTPQGGPLSDRDLARLYRACDVGMNTAMGEGWGLVSFEHASTGAAQIVPNHTACAALWTEETAFLINPGSVVVPNFSPLEMGVLRPDDIAATLERAYAAPDARAKIARAGQRFATRPNYRWSRIADQIDQAFSACLTETI